MKMDKKNVVRWILDILGAFIAVYVLWSVNKINDLVESDIRQGIEITTMGETLTSMAINISRVADVLDSMLFEQELANRLREKTMSDRWSAGCMEDHDREWLKFFQNNLPSLEIHADDLPDVRGIQRANGF